MALEWLAVQISAYGGNYGSEITWIQIFLPFTKRKGFHRNSELWFTYGNDPEIFSISIMEMVPEIRNDFRNDFFPVNQKFPHRCSGFRNILEFRNFPETSPMSLQ